MRLEVVVIGLMLIAAFLIFSTTYRARLEPAAGGENSLPLNVQPAEVIPQAEEGPKAFIVVTNDEPRVITNGVIVIGDGFKIGFRE